MATGRVQLRATGAADLRELSRALKLAGQAGLRKELYAGLGRAMKPLRADIITSASRTLPSGGGRRVKRRRKSDSLADRAAGASYRVSSAAGRTPRITLQAAPKARKPIDLKSADAGRVAHPLFGDRRHWYGQAVTAGWFSVPVERHKDTVLAECLKAIDDVKRQIT